MVVENGTNRNVDTTFIVDFPTHRRPVLHRLATVYNATDKHTDRTIGIGRLSSSIGGLIMRFVALYNNPVTNDCSFASENKISPQR